MSQQAMGRKNHQPALIKIGQVHHDVLERGIRGGISQALTLNGAIIESGLIAVMPIGYIRSACPASELVTC